jgi:PAS domain-containing protein
VAEVEPRPEDFQLALDAMRDGVILWSADGRVVGVERGRVSADGFA